MAWGADVFLAELSYRHGKIDDAVKNTDHAKKLVYTDAFEKQIKYTHYNFPLFRNDVLAANDFYVLMRDYQSLFREHESANYNEAITMAKAILGVTNEH